jgi:hypothetical protein
MLALALVCALSLGADEKISVQAEVVFASTAPGAVEPGLADMQKTMAARVKYLTLKRLSSQTLELRRAPRDATVSLPNQKKASLTLEALKDGAATLRIRLAPTDATSTLGNGKSLYQQAGPFEGGDLWLVLSQPK